MVLFLIGLGLGNEKDISIRGLEAVQSSKAVYLESYTSILGVDRAALEAFYKREVIEADRDLMEQGLDAILENMKGLDHTQEHISFLVIGDPYCATTHNDLFLRAVQLGIPVEVIHNASIVNAVGCCGMQVYRFGEIISIPFFTDNWRPYSFYPKILSNVRHKLHTLLLLDIKVKEQSIENMLKNRPIYEPPRFMTIQQCVEQLLEVEDKAGEGAYNRKTKCIGLARIGMQGQRIISGSMEDFINKIDMGPQLHSFVICSEEMHPIEQEMYQYYLAK